MAARGSPCAYRRNAPMPSIRIYVKKQIRLDRLNFKQNQMFKVGTMGVTSVKSRLAASQGPADSPAKPLTRAYAIAKSKRGKGNRRNLMLTGDMLGNFMVRTVSENKATANLTTRKGRIKAWINQKLEPWMVFSPKNKVTVAEATRQALAELTPRLLVERLLGGKQQ